MNKIMIACVALAASFGGFAEAAHAQERTQFQYTGDGFTGVFYADPAHPGLWQERVSDGRAFSFVETRPTKGYIELYDASRDVTVRLTDDVCFIRHSGTHGRFVFLYHGYWVPDIDVVPTDGSAPIRRFLENPIAAGAEIEQ